MSAVTAEFLQTAWKGLDAHHVARALRRFVPGIDYMGISKSLIVEDLLREKRGITQAQALEVATLAGDAQRAAAFRRNTERAEKAQAAEREGRLRALQKQVRDYLAAHPECPLSLDAALIGNRGLFTVWLSPEVFHAHLLRLHEVMPGFVFSAQAGAWVDLYFPPEKLDIVAALFSDMRKEEPNV